MIWAKAYEIFGGIVGFIMIYMMKVYNFIKTTNYARFGDFSVGFNVNVVFSALGIGFVFVGMES